MASFIVKKVRIFTGEEVIESGNVFVEEGIIKYVGNDTPNTDVPVVFGSGSTLIPGLIDAHIHADKGRVLALEQSLRFGVTTVLDMHNEPPNVAKLKKIAKERKDVADFKSCCLAATIDQGWPIPIVTMHDKSEETLAEVATWPKLAKTEDVEQYMQQNIKDGADYTKLMHESGKIMGQKFNIPSIELQTAVVKAAHDHGLIAVAHALTLADTLAILEAGVDGLTHTFSDTPPTRELIEAYKAKNTFCIPTLLVHGSVTGEGGPIAASFANDHRAIGKIADAERASMCDCMHFGAQTCKVENAYESVRQLKAAGIDILCGSDAAGPALGTAWGLSIHQELYLFVHEAGFTPQEALRSATSLNAKRFGLHDRGLITQARKADLVLIQGNPLENIRDTLNLKAIWRDGHKL